MARATTLLAGLFLAALAGCLPQQTTTRSQVADDVTDGDQFSTIGKITAIGNVESIPVSGVGLVYNLPGTGSSPTADGWRTMLEQSIRRQKGNPKEFLDDPKREHSLVLVSAMIPPGARAGDKLDVSISLPPGSKTTSLKGGILFPTDLQNFELAANARQALQSSGIPVGKVPVANEGTILPGSKMVIASGALIAGYDNDAKPSADGELAPEGPRSGRIWGGAKNLIDRPYYFMLNESNPQPRLALVIAERINSVFPTPGGGANKLADAKVQGKPLVVCYAPPTYRLNHTRFLLVARQVPLEAVKSDSPYRKQLENDLLRPETTITAAIKLEALGLDSRQPLRVGLQSDSPWVRFASAEALTYLGHSDGAKDLAELAEKHPSIRTQCLTALASLDDAVCLDQLAELMRKPDSQLRYGAFIALRSADENHEAIRGKRINGSFWLHNVVLDSEPMVHVATERRAEIVLFGSRFPMRTPFSFALGKEFTVSAKDGEPMVTITRIKTGTDGEPTAVNVKCLNDMGTVLKGLSELGGSYPESVEFIRRAQKAEIVTTAVLFDSAPKGLSVPQLAMIALNDSNMEKANHEVTRIGSEDIVQASYDLPTEADAMKSKPKADATLQSLNREPGRLFGPSVKK